MRNLECLIAKELKEAQLNSAAERREEREERGEQDGDMEKRRKLDNWCFGGHIT